MGRERLVTAHESCDFCACNATPTLDPFCAPAIDRKSALLQTSIMIADFKSDETRPCEMFGGKVSAVDPGTVALELVVSFAYHNSITQASVQSVLTSSELVM